MDRYYIKEDQNKSLVHFGPYSSLEYTLCGLEYDGDDSLGLHPYQVVKKPVTCERCLMIMDACKKQKLVKGEL